MSRRFRARADAIGREAESQPRLLRTGFPEPERRHHASEHGQKRIKCVDMHRVCHEDVAAIALPHAGVQLRFSTGDSCSDAIDVEAEGRQHTVLDASWHAPAVKRTDSDVKDDCGLVEIGGEKTRAALVAEVV